MPFLIKEFEEKSLPSTFCQSSRSETGAMKFLPLCQFQGLKMQCYFASPNSMAEFGFQFTKVNDAFKLYRTTGY